MTDPSLEELRAQIERLDAELVTLAAERVALARRVGEIKRRLGRPTVDFAREARVLERARALAEALGLAPGVAEDIVSELIAAAVSAQDEDGLRVSAAGAGKRAVLVGGAGRMGRWMGRFLSTMGYETAALDGAAPLAENERARSALPDADLVVMATPPGAIASLYREWRAAPPSGLIVDIASIKSPLVEPIRELQERGARVASIHPMFGPSATLLRDADVVICDTGDEQAASAVERLFSPTTARLVRLPLDEHDRIMADLLSLAHATAITFALALPEGRHAVSSTTFGRLESLAESLVRESPDVYYEIQSRNPYSGVALERLRVALERVVEAAGAPGPEPFRALFAEAQGRSERAGPETGDRTNP